MAIIKKEELHFAKASEKIIYGWYVKEINKFCCKIMDKKWSSCVVIILLIIIADRP